MRRADLDYDLPPEAIAQVPAAERTAARLLVVDAAGHQRHRTVAALPELVGPGDLLVVNDTRVRRARLHLRKSSGGAVEVLLLDRRPDGTWEALVRPGRRVRSGAVLVDAAGHPVVRVLGPLDDGVRQVELVGVDPQDVAAAEGAVEALGELPLPPYVTGALEDPERYQTTYARRPGSVAAPTAGLHLTPELLDACLERGATVATLELEVGLGTFRPIEVDDVADHRMHRERYRVPAATWDACGSARRVLAVGTTTVRALESVAAGGPLAGASELFIRPGHEFAVVDVLLTNFHLPRSSLLAMLEAFMGPAWRAAYAEALAEGYRFLSLGDAMLVERAR